MVRERPNARKSCGGSGVDPRLNETINRINLRNRIQTPLQATVVPVPLQATVVPVPLQATVVPAPLQATVVPAPLQVSPMPIRSFWCRTGAELTDEVHFEWTIEQFSFLDDGKKWEPLTSSEFSDSKFSLRLCVDHSHSQYYMVLLCPFSFTYSILVDIVIFDERRNQMSQETTSIFANTKFPVRVFEAHRPSLLKPGNFVRGEMTINCKIRSLKRKLDLGILSGSEEAISEKNQHQILHQLQEMFENMPLSDVTFIIRDRKVAAHKNILAMRSPVFKAMFHHPTKEALSSQVEINDMDPDVFQEILRFIYTGQTQSKAMNKMAPNLLAAANKYELEDLKSCCETHLIRQMSAENCLELLSLTTHHPAEYLKKYAVKFFRLYPGDVMKTANWEKMQRENPAALCDLQKMVLTAPTF